MAEPHSFDKRFLGFSSYFIGPSATGKTTGIEDLLFALRNLVSNVIVFCPTDATEGMYSGEGNKARSVRIPKMAIHDELTVDMLVKILDRQAVMSAIYNKTRDATILTQLFGRVATPTEHAEVQRMKGITDRTIQSLRQRAENTIMDQQTITDKYNASYIEYLRTVINTHLPRLTAMSRTAQPPFSDDENVVITQFNINPETVIILDDVTEQLQKLRACDEIKKIITKGRYYHLTVIFAVHFMGAIAVDLRESAFFNVYFGGGVEDYYCGGKVKVQSNIKAMAMATIARIRATHANNPRAAPKLVWDRIGNKFDQIRVQPHDVFRFPNNDAFWELCEAARDKNKSNVRAEALDRYKPRPNN